MSVLRYGEKLTEYQEVRLLREEFDILNGMEVNLTCHVRGLSSALDKHRLLYILQSNLAVKATEERFCTTNVGPSGYFEEDITLLCKWNSVRVRPNPISLDEETIEEYPCQSHESIKVCNLSMLKFNIYPFLEVEVTPPFFLEESNVLEFFCKSTPPRLLYWKVFGSNGDILDLDHYRTSISVDTNVTIKQYAGETTIRISEAVAGGNGFLVNKVYETKKEKILNRALLLDTYIRLYLKRANYPNQSVKGRTEFNCNQKTKLHSLNNAITKIFYSTYPIVPVDIKLRKDTNKTCIPRTLPLRPPR
ncbi:hypothetical protein HOLleu_28055 [Holothuria leucospilota]|uniref:Uncharacterized protein n=1 Tax=Holothuria leucospilota TaxID=206669 RepID=A0A9Q1H3P3_HOLLE|nr:hypothetical protein HOLleu_28055 [Holothuria leucospilota]